jgi:hypothetical protein
MKKLTKKNAKQKQYAALRYQLAKVLLTCPKNNLLGWSDAWAAMGELIFTGAFDKGWDSALAEIITRNRRNAAFKKLRELDAKEQA